MFENDDELENIKPDLSLDDDSQDIDLMNDSESLLDKNIEEQTEMSIDDIFAEIPPMPEDYEETVEIGTAYQTQNRSYISLQF